MHYRHCILFVISFNLICNLFLGTTQENTSIIIFAASSLTDAFTDLKDSYTQQHPEVDIILNFAGSSTLVAQLQGGAPADIFASANEQQMQMAIDDGRITADTIEIFATNQLVVVMPADNPANIMTLEDLANDGILLVLAVPDVPIRVYTDEMLLRLNEQFGEDFYDNVLDNLVSEESNVRQVVARVALGEADAGIVYQTDITPEIRDDVITLAIDPEISPLATYPIAPLADSTSLEVANDFIAYVLSADGQAILKEHGFCPPVTIEPESEVTPEATSEPLDEVTATPTPFCE